MYAWLTFIKTSTNQLFHSTNIKNTPSVTHKQHIKLHRQKYKTMCWICTIWTTTKQNSELFLLRNSLNRCSMRKFPNTIHKTWFFLKNKSIWIDFLSQLACFVLKRLLLNTNWFASLPEFDSLYERRSHNQCIDSVVKFAHCITRV